MKRRAFLAASGLSAVTQLRTLTSAGGISGVRERPRGLPNTSSMRLGTQRRPVNREILEFCARHGVEGICGHPEITKQRRWNLEEILRMQEHCDSYGVRLELLGGALTSAGIERQVFPNILLGKDPERDREIDLFCDMIRVAAEAGVHCIKYNLAILPVLRTKPTVGRGNSAYSTWRYADAEKDLGPTDAGEVSSDLFWERIDHFLQRMIPVASEYRVRMACHQHDPGVPPKGYRGVRRVLGTVDGIKKFIELVESPYHGLNLCVGTVAEMLLNPSTEILTVVRYLGKRKKIFNVHLRNIKGRRDDFQEVYPDEGDLDLLEVLKVLKEVGYKYLIMPDHMPRHPDDPKGRQAFAFGFGYIKGLLHSLDASV